MLSVWQKNALEFVQILALSESSKEAFKTSNSRGFVEKSKRTAIKKRGAAHEIPSNQYSRSRIVHVVSLNLCL